MIFTARLRRLSPLWGDWRREGRVGGMINGVQFRWQDGYYCTVGLNNEQVAMLLQLPFVEVEAAGFMPEPGYEPEPDPPAKPVAKPEPAKPVAKPASKASNGSQ